MSLSRPSLAVLAGLAALAVTQPARAAVMQAVFSGVVTQDRLGFGADMFGLDESQLVGSAYKMTFRYDTSLGLIQTGPGFGSLSGGPSGSPPTDVSPILLAQVEINGVAVSIAGAEQATMTLISDASLATPRFVIGAADDILLPFTDPTSIPAIAADVRAPGANVPLDFTRPFAIHGGEFDVESGARLFTFARRQPVDEIEFLGASTDVVVSRFGSGAPEPATWALAVVGFGLTGAALRRRRAPGTTSPSTAAAGA